ncbi:hypothetical protein [Agrobacterium sp. Azo12]|uniref:hypothetical protein n=1 Tax=Agrobacterium sp. Azo12 TaxID=3031129 RepID=UPI0023D81A08|nr:hypothetical protein [Agrobacterium sp. Azo12]MDO5897886.1 hypothetical protein [Agrobacterium sp. Azo12]
MKRFAHVFFFIIASVLAGGPGIATAASIDIKMFGHHVIIQQRDFEQVLSIDGRDVLKDSILTVDDVRMISGIPTIIGSSSPGGNACDSSPFVVSFPTDGNPRVDGPIESCYPVNADVLPDKIVFSTRALPTSPGQTWTWTPKDGLAKSADQQFVADSSKGWSALREKTATHPSDLLSYGEIAAQINGLLATEKDFYSDIILGVGSGSFEGDYFVGSACTRHMCNEQEALLVAGIQEKKVFLAWKPSGEKIVVRPPVKEWPDKAKFALREWAEKWK